MMLIRRYLLRPLGSEGAKHHLRELFATELLHGLGYIR